MAGKKTQLCGLSCDHHLLVVVQLTRPPVVLAQPPLLSFTLGKR